MIWSPQNVKYVLYVYLEIILADKTKLATLLKKAFELLLKLER